MIKQVNRHADVYCTYMYIMITSQRDWYRHHIVWKEKDNNRKRVAPSVVTIRSSYEWKWNMNSLDCFFVRFFLFSFLFVCLLKRICITDQNTQVNKAWEMLSGTYIQFKIIMRRKKLTQLAAAQHQQSFSFLNFKRTKTKERERERKIIQKRWIKLSMLIGLLKM